MYVCVVAAGILPIVVRYDWKMCVCVLSQLAYCPLGSDMTGRRVCCHSWHTAHCGQI